MSEIKVDTVVDAAGTGKPNFSNGVTMNGAALSTLNLGEYNASSSEPSSPENGSIWWDTTNEKIFVYIAGEWKETIIIPPPAWFGARGLFFGGDDNGDAHGLNEIDYFAIDTAGNATDFGNMSGNSYNPTACSSGSRAVTSRGFTGFGGSNTIEYVTTATTGNVTDFGDLTSTSYGGGACSDASRGLFWAGERNIIDYITIDTTGNATDFGDDGSSSGGPDSVECASNATYGFRMGGSSGGGALNVIKYVTIQTLGNAQDVGDLTIGVTNLGASEDRTRAVVFGGYSSDTHQNTIQYFATTGTSGNASDFGDLTTASHSGAACSNGTKAIHSLGTTGANNSPTNRIDQVTIQTTANSTDFGDLIRSKMSLTSASGSAS